MIDISSGKKIHPPYHHILIIGFLHRLRSDCGQWILQIFDDNAYITENNHIQSGINPESITWAFTSLDVFYWHPITWLSHMLDWSLFGANASGSFILSACSCISDAVIFLFLFLNKTTNNIWAFGFCGRFFSPCIPCGWNQ